MLLRAVLFPLQAKPPETGNGATGGRPTPDLQTIRGDLGAAYDLDYGFRTRTAVNIGPDGLPIVPKVRFLGLPAQAAPRPAIA